MTSAGTTPGSTEFKRVTDDQDGAAGVGQDLGFNVPAVLHVGLDETLTAALVVTGRDRCQAIERGRRAPAEFDISGVRTTLPFLRAVLAEPAFTAGDPDGFAVHTSWIEQDYLPAADTAGAGMHPGRVTGLHARVGDTVAQGAVLCRVTGDAAGERAGRT